MMSERVNQPLANFDLPIAFWVCATGLAVQLNTVLARLAAWTLDFPCVAFSTARRVQRQDSGNDD
jgi:hypothetical protein